MTAPRKLVELDPSFLGEGGDDVTHNGAPMPRREGVGIACRCPCGCDKGLFVPFATALDGSPSHYGDKGWQRTGDTFETLTLTPSILRRDAGGCGWHGYLTNGEFVSC